jgi:hypothetical protein
MFLGPMARKESWKSRAINCGRRATYYASVISVHRTPNILPDWRRPRLVLDVLYHIQSARHSKDLGVKLVDYCTAAESLFLSSSGELMHQLSERIASFDEKAGVSRIETYRRFKRAYNFRSRVVHGAAISAKDLTGNCSPPEHRSRVMDGAVRMRSTYCGCEAISA